MMRQTEIGEGQVVCPEIVSTNESMASSDDSGQSSYSHNSSCMAEESLQEKEGIELFKVVEDEDWEKVSVRLSNEKLTLMNNNDNEQQAAVSSKRITNDLKQKVRTLKSEMDHMSESICQSQETISHLKAAILNLRVDMSTTQMEQKKKKKAFRFERQTVADEHATLQKTIHDWNQKNHSLEVKIVEEKAITATLYEQRIRSERSKKEESEDFQNAIALLRAEVSRITNVVNQRKETITALRSRVQTKDLAIDELEQHTIGEEAKLQSEILSLRAKLSDANSTVMEAGFVSEKEALDAKIFYWKGQIANSETCAAEMARAAAEAAVMIRSVTVCAQKQNELLQHDLKELRNDLFATKMAATDFDENHVMETKKLIEEEQVMKDTIDDLTKKNKSLEAMVIELKKDIYQLTGANESVKSELDSTIRASKLKQCRIVRSSCDELALLRGRDKDLEAELTSSKRLNRTLLDEENQLNAKLHRLLNDINATSISINTDVESLAKKLADDDVCPTIVFSAEKNALDTENCELSSLLHVSSMDRERLQNEKRHLKSELAKLNAYDDRYRTEITNMKTDLVYRREKYRIAVDELNGKIGALKAGNAELVTMVANEKAIIWKERRRLGMKIAELIRSNDDFDEHVTFLSQKVTSLSSSRDEAISHHHRMRKVTRDRDVSLHEVMRYIHQIPDTPPNNDNNASSSSEKYEREPWPPD